MIDGVISFGPSHDTPVKGAPNVAGSISVFSPEPRTRLNSNEPFASVLVDCTLLPDESSRSTLAPGMPSSPCSTLPGVPPPGLKSRQTTPVTERAFGVGGTACWASAGTSEGGIAVRPIFAVSPAWSGRRNTNPRCGVPVSRGLDAFASCNTAGDENQLFTAPMPALTAPCCGSLMYITCQITPVAKSEIAIGMKTIVLKATAQRMRSVS